MATAGARLLKDAIDRGAFEPVYLLYGADEFRKDEAIRQVIEAATDAGTRDFNLDQRRGGELDAGGLSSLLEALPMMATRRVVVLRDIGALKKPVRAQLDRYLAAPAADTVLVLHLAGDDDPDAALLKRVVAVELAAMNEREAQQWVVRRAKTLFNAAMAEDAAALLVAYAGREAGTLASEVEKLAAFTRDGAIDRAAVEAVVGVRPGETLGDLLDLVAARDAVGAARLVPVVLAQPKTTGVQIVLALTTQFLAMGWGLAMRANGTSAGALRGSYYDLLKSGTALTGRSWGDAIASWVNHLGAWDRAAIDAGLAQLIAADRALKETRVSSEEQLLTSIVLTLGAPARGRRVA